MFTWPIVTEEDEAAVLEVLRRGGMSGMDVTKQFEAEFAAWNNTEHALGFSTGTAALQAAMWACGVRRGDEIICPSLTYWASALPVFSLGGTVVFAEVEPDSLCLDPTDIEHRITERTRAIVVVHYTGHPADMDPIMTIAERHGVKVIEDVSHAHGGLYRGRKLGTIGDVGAMSLMTGKPLAVGEAGMLVTDDADIVERAVAWAHYGRHHGDPFCDPALEQLAGIPQGGYKYRMHQLSAAVGRVQLKHYDQRAIEIRKAMNHFWDLLAGVPGIRAHRVAEASGSTMGGWYSAAGLYSPDQLGGLSLTRFCEAVAAEGAVCMAGINRPLHLHPVFNEADIYGDGKPTRIAHSHRDLRQPSGSLPTAELIAGRAFRIPWFKRFRPAFITQQADAYRKVAEHHQALLADDPGDPADIGGWTTWLRR
jgi:dTDP-4-amino-4,6-dideoxygalactose transaminase